MEENKSQRVRRTRNELKTAMLDAVMQLAKEKQLSLITMVDVGERSGIRVDVLTRNFTNMEKILSIYAASVDYWIADIFQGECPTDHVSEKDMKEMFDNLLNSLYNDPDMQRLLIWEITEDNSSTRRLAASREQAYREVIEGYKDMFKDSGLHVDIFSAILTAGIYYLILRRKRSTFWGVDFTKRSERKRFGEAVNQFISLMFDAMRKRNEKLEIARNFKKKGVADEVIAECTGLTLEVVKGLI